MSESPAKILIVDDKPVNIGLLHQILSHKNYSISGVPSGVLALKIAREFHPDVILLDVMMPEMDGFETCRKLLLDPCTKNIPIIFVTAKTEGEDIAHGFRCGAVDYITKPINELEVWARVGHQIELKRLIEKQASLISELKYSEYQNREVINRASDPMVTVDSQGLIKSVNPATIRLLGFRRKQLIEKPFVELLNKESQVGLQNCFLSNTNSSKNKHIDKGPIEVMIEKKDCQHIPVDLSISQVGFGTPLFLCLFHDLTLHKNLIKELRRLTHIDKLTNLYNRRRLDSFLCEEWSRSIRSHQPLTALFFDIDFFKQYNDHLGHQSGDECLQEIAQALEESICRPADLVARYGGEEFVAILPETDLQGGQQVAENLLRKIEQLKIPHPRSKVSEFVTVSIGISSRIADKSVDTTILLEMADKALYQAKQNGRNRAEYLV